MANTWDEIIVDDCKIQNNESIVQFPLVECENYHLSQQNYDSSTVVSESVRSSNDYGAYENNAIDLNGKAPLSILENGSPVKISVGNSTDVSIGNKTFITGPVVIKQFIADSATLQNGYQKDKATVSFAAPDIIDREKTTIKERLNNLLEFFRRRPVIIATAVVVISAVIAASFCGYYLQLAGVEPSDSDDFELITREEYDALPRRGVLGPLNLPVKYVIIGHTVGGNCTEMVRCKQIVRYIQQLHMDENGWDEIGLNFLVGGDGRVYEGSGYEEGSHTYGYNFDSIIISLIGTFANYAPSEQQLETTKKLIRKGVAENKIQRQYVLYPQRLFAGGESPGKFVYDEIAKWQYFSSVVLPEAF